MKRLILTALLCGSLNSVNADIYAYVFNDDGVTQPRNFIKYGPFYNETFEMTDMSGRIKVPGSGYTAQVKVFAHNPVVRVLKDNGLNPFDRFWSKDVTLYNGFNAIHNKELVIAEKLRAMYNATLREFGPWNNREFPNRSSRTSSNYIEVAYRSILTTTAWVEPAGVTTGRPVIHLSELYSGDNTLVHELAHALHFSKLSKAKRDEIANTYGAWLAEERLAGDSGNHNFSVPTTPFVAYIEAFGHFNKTWWETRTLQNREQAFFDTRWLDEPNRFIKDEGYVDSTNDRCHFVDGDDTEGAIYCTLFLAFASQNGVGLDYVVTTYVDCQSLDIHEYASCIATREGRDSSIYRALYNSAREFEIALPIPTYVVRIPMMTIRR